MCGQVCCGSFPGVPKPRMGARPTQYWASQERSWPKWGPRGGSRWQQWEELQLRLGPGRRHPHPRPSTVWECTRAGPQSETSQPVFAPVPTPRVGAAGARQWPDPVSSPRRRVAEQPPPPPPTQLGPEDEAHEGPHPPEMEVGECEGPAKPEVGMLARPASPPPEACPPAARQPVWEPRLTATPAAPPPPDPPRHQRRWIRGRPPELTPPCRWARVQTHLSVIRNHTSPA